MFGRISTGKNWKGFFKLATWVFTETSPKKLFWGGLGLLASGAVIGGGIIGGGFLIDAATGFTTFGGFTGLGALLTLVVVSPLLILGGIALLHAASIGIGRGLRSLFSSKSNQQDQDREKEPDYDHDRPDRDMSKNLGNQQRSASTRHQVNSTLSSNSKGKGRKKIIRKEIILVRDRQASNSKPPSFSYTWREFLFGTIVADRWQQEQKEKQNEEHRHSPNRGRNKGGM